ncbi:large-conductance mechanosensitive channel protein MscL [Candidatus Woesearchaeota archaeon]|nr:large-conductance mechanosensitive channel protein MscL [Candidatus Woesearchaeota archaeon]
MSIIHEFKEFAVKGNMLDMAVGIILGVAFGKVITSFVNDIIMPPMGLLIGGVNFKDLAVVLKEATETAAAVSINYGLFINTLLDFLIVAIVIFFMIKGINRLRRFSEKEEKKKIK